jgi:DNA-directed RNA polymerase subunit K/omega
MKTQLHLATDVWGTAEKLQKQDVSIYDMILAAAVNARAISKRRNFLDAKEGRLNKYSMKPINQALKEIEDEVNNKESE